MQHIATLLRVHCVVILLLLAHPTLTLSQSPYKNHDFGRFSGNTIDAFDHYNSFYSWTWAKPEGDEEGTCGWVLTQGSSAASGSFFDEDVGKEVPAGKKVLIPQFINGK